MRDLAGRNWREVGRREEIEKAFLESGEGVLFQGMTFGGIDGVFPDGGLGRGGKVVILVTTFSFTGGEDAVPVPVGDAIGERERFTVEIEEVFREAVVFGDAVDGEGVGVNHRERGMPEGEREPEPSADGGDDSKF